MANESMGGAPRNTPQNSYPSKPFASRSEMLVDHALRYATMDPNAIRDMRPVARPQQLFPSREGANQAWTIEGVLNIDRFTPSYRSWQSGMQMQRSPIAEQGQEGTLRHSMQTTTF